ncbi:hypothetical protein LCGC14_1028280 [marine sediment metagenome]|uniref:Uncharacterized protein n=1 Tax=marine sediment metagenome TaxID=412755 RepID=A0A0F9QDJ8_9ZZZZ
MNNGLHFADCLTRNATGRPERERLVREEAAKVILEQYEEIVRLEAIVDKLEKTAEAAEQAKEKQTARTV